MVTDIAALASPWRLLTEGVGDGSSRGGSMAAPCGVVCMPQMQRKFNQRGRREYERWTVSHAPQATRTPHRIACKAKAR